MKKYICLFLAISMLCFWAPVQSEANDSNTYKISQMLDYFDNTKDAATAQAYVEMTDVDHAAVMTDFSKRYPEEYSVYINAKFDAISEKPKAVSSDLSKKDAGFVMSGNVGASTADPLVLQNAIEHKRAVYTEYYRQSNNAILARSCTAKQQVFVSQYAPMAIVEISRSDAYTLAKNADVLSVTPVGNVKFQSDTLDLANRITRANYNRDTCGLTGSGVKIGMVEHKGLPNVNDIYLSNASITLQPNVTASSYYHATLVAKVLVGEDSSGSNDGLAPDSQLYCATFDTDDYRSYFIAIEWLISSGANVINASTSMYYDENANTSVEWNGTYRSIDRWVDHIAVQHDIHFVNSAGNSDEGPPAPYNIRVRSAAMAYNAITVGALDSNQTENVAGFTINQYSCYAEGNTTSPRKPNLVAPGQNIFGETGTSAAAPQVAGTIAQLCQMNATLKVKQSAMGAILMASAAEKVDGNGAGSTGELFVNAVRISGTDQISDKEGAGILDARWARGIVLYSNFWSYSLAANQFPFTKTLTIDASSNSLNRVAIFWLKEQPHPGIIVLV